MRLDGGLATTLQQLGLAPFSPVEPWLSNHPDRVRRAHQAFVDAGAQAVLTASFLAAATPETLAHVVAQAVEIARTCGVSIWGCSGPVAADTSTYAAMANDLRNNGVEQMVLETFTSAAQAVDALSAVRQAAPDMSVVVSVVPCDGRVLGCSTPLAEVYDALMTRGARGVGANCATPEQVLTAHDHANSAPFWAKPSHTDDWVRRTRPLRSRCEWLGGCCGVSPTDLSELWAAP
ncbi:MAG: homocysteine S-methyltransferase [Myxococcota bacterium]|jgi:homocysteine S-methyltransferase